MYPEFRFAARSLARWRGGFAVAVVTLATGIGTAIALYALAGALLAKFPGVPELDRVVRVYAASGPLGVDRAPVALAEFDRALAGVSSFAAAGAYAAADATIGASTGARAVHAAYASPGFFSALAVPPAIGRAFTPADIVNAQPVVVLSHALWTREFSSADLRRARILVDGVERAVVGVMPPKFSYPFAGIAADLWIPLGRASAATPPIVTVFARLRNDVTLAQANADLDTKAEAEGGWTWRALPLDRDVRTRAAQAYAVTLGPAALILLMACVNIGCLLLARGAEREKDLAIRRAFGASRSRLVRLLLTESVLLATVAGVLGTALALLLLRAIAKAFAGIDSAVSAQLTGGGMPWIAITTTLIACVAFGLLPAIRLSRRDVLASLNGRPARLRTAKDAYGTRDLVVFSEVAIATGLMVWTAMLLTLFAQLRGVYFAFPAEQIVAMRVQGNDAAAAMARVAAVPGVSRVAVSSGMLGGGDRVRMQTPGGGAAILARVPVGPGFLETLGVAIVQGRSFNASDITTGAANVVLSEAAAARLGVTGNAVGMRLHTNIPGAPDAVVVGVCHDAVDHGTLTRAGLVPAEIYVPFDPSARETVILARLTGDPHTSLPAISAAGATREGVRPPRAVVLSDEFRARERDGSPVVARMAGVFAMLTLLLAGSGVFAVIRQTVTQRTREFGIRIAIGGAPGRVLGMVIAREGRLIGLAMIVGVVFSLGLTLALFDELTTITALLPQMPIGAFALCAAVVATSCGLAALRIVRLEPASILRGPF